MKMIPTTGAAPITSFQAYVHNCKRNASCQPSFAAPLPGVPYLQLYVDFGQYQPLTFEIQLQDMCDTGHTEQIFPSNYIVGQTPEGMWYGVFKYFTSPIIPVTNFVAWLSSLVDAPTGLVEKTFFSELYIVDPCDNLMKVKSCQPEGATITGFDVNDVYYGLPANVDFLGVEGVRYFHIAYVRRGKVREISNKATFKSSLIRNFRTTIEKTWQLESEIVPQWYKDELLAIFARGAVQVDDGTTYLVSDLNFEALNDDDLQWKPFAQLKATFRLYFGCDSSECVECCSPVITSAEVLSMAASDSGDEDGNENVITIEFTPCEPTPADGYLVSYRPLNTSGAYLTASVTGSPAIIVDLDGEFGQSYEGFIQGDCGNGQLGLPINWQAINENAPSDESESGSASAGGCEPLPISWDFTRIGAVGVMAIKVNGTTIVNPSSNSSGTFFVNEGDSIQVLVSGSGDSFRSIVISGVIGGVLFSDSQQSNISHTFTAECFTEGYEISGTVEAA